MIKQVGDMEGEAMYDQHEFCRDELWFHLEQVRKTVQGCIDALDSDTSALSEVRGDLEDVVRRCTRG